MSDPAHIAHIAHPTDRALTALAEFGAASRSARTVEDVWDALVAALHRGLGAEQVHVQEIAQDAGTSRGLVSLGAPGAAPIVADAYVQVLDGRPSAIEWVLSAQRILHEPEARRSDIIRQDHVERWGIESCLFLPVVVGEEVRAVAGVASAQRRTWTGSEIAAARTAMELTGLGLARLEAEERSRAEVRQLTAVARAARVIGATLDLQEVLASLAKEAGLALDSDIAGVYLGDAETGGLAVAGYLIPDGWLGRTIRPGEGVGGRTLVSGRTEMTNDYQHGVEIPSIPVLQGIQTAVSVPVRWDGELRGALSIAFNRMRRITPEDLEVLEAIADLAGVACRNAEAYEEAKEAAATDSLTGALNHGAMQERLREEIDRARRNDEPLCVALVDLDDFKQLNDAYGHRAGDRLLARVAQEIGSLSRPYDGLARYGGDEFVLILPGTRVQDAVSAAERVRRAVRATSEELALSGIAVDASIGVAGWHEPLAPAELLERADRALLVAKRQGKDRVIVADASLDEDLAMLEVRSGSPSALVRDFWDELAVSVDPSEALTSLPSFLRRRLELEEVALFEAGAGVGPAILRRANRARYPGDPGPAAFTRDTYFLGPGHTERMSVGSLWRASLEELLRVLGVESGPRGPRGAYAAIPLWRSGRLRGLLLMRSARPAFPLDALQQAEALTRQATVVLSGEAGEGSIAAVQALAAAIDARDNYTHEHSEQVVALASAVARGLRLPAREIERVERAALLHDVGKVAIPNEILHKSGPLDAREWEIMREHPVIGERILRRTPELTDIAPLVRHEHERFDGAGYPDGIAGRAIPIGSRIILACDAYNAMITERPYRRPRTPEDAMSELQAHAGTQFDPDVVTALLRVLAPDGAVVATS